MEKHQGSFAFYGVVFSQVASTTSLVALLELVLNRLHLFESSDSSFIVLHLLILLPCVLLVTPAGYFSDKYPKERVLRITSLLMIPAVGVFGVAAYIGSMTFVFAAAALFFVLQAIASPAKSGYLKELVGVRMLANGAGRFTIVTFVSLLLSAAATAVAFEQIAPQTLDFAHLMQGVLPIIAGIAVVELLGTVFAFAIPSIGAYDAEMKFPH